MLVARNANETMMGPTVGSGRVCIRQESGSWFYVGVSGRNLASVIMKMFLICNSAYKKNVINSVL